MCLSVDTNSSRQSSSDPGQLEMPMFTFRSNTDGDCDDQLAVTKVTRLDHNAVTN